MTGEGASVLAHELRSPVAALAAIAEAVAERGEEMGPDERAHLLELAVAAARDIERLVTDPEQLSVHPQEVVVADLLRSVASDGVAIESSRELAVVADPVRMRQVLTNLVANGRRHGTHVSISAVEHEGVVRIAVADDGPGVEPGVDVFAAGVSGVGSTGYGLAVARAIAHAHGGEIELESRPGAGATFTLVLPSSSAAP